MLDDDRLLHWRQRARRRCSDDCCRGLGCARRGELGLGSQVLGNVKECTLRVDDTLAFKDGVAEGFGDKVRGANAGDKREVAIVLSDAAANPQLRSRTVPPSSSTWTTDTSPKVPAGS